MVIIMLQVIPRSNFDHSSNILSNGVLIIRAGQLMSDDCLYFVSFDLKTRNVHNSCKTESIDTPF
jgi:hypothetical protein